MKRFLTFCLPLLLLFGACAARRTSYLAAFEAPFEAELAGEVNGVAFSAMLEAGEGATATRAVTLTFYAPETLAGTVFCRTEAGELCLKTGDVAVTVNADSAFGELLAAIGGESAVGKATLTDAGYTRVQGEGFSWDFRSDGTPASLITPRLTATVVRFAPIDP